MAAIVRLRHPNGTANLDLTGIGTVHDLQLRILAVTEIPPSQQELKKGYPPQPLTIIPELPLEALGLQRGDQLVVTQTSPPKSHQPLPSHPASAFDQQRSQSASGGPEIVRLSDGSTLIHRVVPDDNSCLFNAIALVFAQPSPAEVRKLAASLVSSDPETYSDAVLGRPVKEYIETILKPNTWGGAIELAVLSKHFDTQIASIDVETGRVDKFGEYPNRCILLYSGIHYDAVSLSPGDADLPPDFHQTMFTILPDDVDPVLKASTDLATKLRAKRAFTNTATFDLKCQQCGVGLKGEKQARSHAAETGHTQFGEY